MMRMLSCCLLFIAVSTSGVLAADPDPAHCEVLPADLCYDTLVFCPDSPQPISASKEKFYIRDNLNALIPDVPIKYVLVNSYGDVVLCPSDPGWNATRCITGSNGYCESYNRGGGCTNWLVEYVRVYAGNVEIRQEKVRSPDWDGLEGDLTVDLVDFVAYGVGPACHDYMGDGVVNLSDLVVFASGYSPSHYCMD